MSIRTKIKAVAAAAALTTAAGLAGAVPALQVGIAGGSYDTSTETIVYSGGTSFTLYAFGRASVDGDGNAINLADTFKFSVAVVPKTAPPGGSFGSFTFGGTTVDVTSGMTYGTPPFEALTGGATDPGDLPAHGVYETYFKEFAFSFSGAKATFCGGNNTQDCPDLAGLSLGTTGGVYYYAVSVDIALLSPTINLHFDLYNTELAKSSTTDLDIDLFAPFSHDGETSSSTSRITSTGAPEPASSSLALLGLAMVGAGLWNRRKASRA